MLGPEWEADDCEKESAVVRRLSLLLVAPEDSVEDPVGLRDWRVCS